MLRRSRIENQRQNLWMTFAESALRNEYLIINITNGIASYTIRYNSYFIQTVWSVLLFPAFLRDYVENTLEPVIDNVS